MGTKIEYVRGKVLEVTGGCTECSVGCENCWARKEVWRMAHNPLLGDKWQGLVKKTSAGLRWTGKIKLFEDALEIPLKRKKPTTYFVDSKADLFHKDVPFEFIKSVLGVIAVCPQHTILLLTKRIERAAELSGAYPDNVHLGVTICNQAEADEKIPIGLQIPGFDWVSAEPLLGPLDILGYPKISTYEAEAFSHYGTPDWYRPKYDGIKGVVVGCESINGKAGRFRELEGGPWLSLQSPEVEACFEEAVSNIAQQCKAAGVGCYVKQIPINGKVEHDMSKFPEDLQVRDDV